MWNAAKVVALAGGLLMCGCDKLHVKAPKGREDPPRDAGPIAGDAGNVSDSDPDDRDAGHGLIDAGHDAGDECATVGCAEPPLCSEGCLADCGCCSCADGEQETRDGVALVCTGGCFMPLQIDAGPACPQVPDAVDPADVVEARGYVPPSDCQVQQPMRVDSEQAFQSAFHCFNASASGIDFSTERLEMFSAGYIGGAAPYRAPDWARTENGVLTVGWSEVVYCGGPRPLDAYTLALVPATAPTDVQGVPCRSGMCDPNEQLP